MNTIIFTEDITLLDFIIRIVTCGPVVAFFIGFIIYQIIFKPIKIHKIQKELMGQGYPKPKSYKKYIWF